MIPNRVVIVDDEPGICDLVQEVAESHHFDSRTAPDSQTFRRLYETFEPSLVILDLNLPGGEDGIELLRFLAEQECRSQVVLFSGADTRTLNTAARLAASRGLELLGTLQKPLTLEALDEIFQQSSAKDRPAVTEAQLREAISRRQFLLHYQPKLSVQSQSSPIIDSVEALVRWQHPQWGLLGPAEFVPLAENAGLAYELTDQVLAEALAQTRRWSDRDIAVTVAVNLPAPLLGDSQLPARIGQMLEEHRVPERQLVLEVTESGAMADATQAMETLTRIRLKGVNLSLDDFGTGYSSLVQLYRMPFSEVKIDKSFVLDLPRSEEAKIIVRSVIELAHNLGMQVCAEGVEERGALDLLRAWGCEKAQGFLFAPPLPAPELEALLLRRGRALQEISQGSSTASRSRPGVVAVSG